MADLPPPPSLFLSHSGEQKGFVHSLYRELLHVNHNPFFDQDIRSESLPKGTPFPSRIVDACRGCKLAVVVLSHDYLESMWPMLELQQFLFHSPSSPNNVYPVFYKLKPADLCNTENLKRWKSKWEQCAPDWHAKNREHRDWQAAASSNSTLLTLDIDKWPEALRILRQQSGEIFPDNKDEHVFIQAIVSNICKRFPPPESILMGDHFKGAKHIQEEIDELFQKQQHGEQEVDDSQRTPIAVGIYGVGGSGKTTVCKYMINFYNEEYPGNCCFLQFPSKEEDSIQLVQSLKDVLSKRGNLHETTLRGIQSVEEAMPHIQKLLRSFRVFLIVDNVCNWSLDIAMAIVTMHLMPGSRLLVTARSEQMLQTLSSYLGNLIQYEGRRDLPAIVQTVHVPSISEEEAIEALMAYSFSSLQLYLTNKEGLRSLARSCFYGEQCHPLLLKAVGTKLRYHGGQAHSAEDWTQVISNLQARIEKRGDGEIEDMIVKVLKTSYIVLDSKLKNIFLNLGTCVPRSQHRMVLSHLTEWLSMVSDDGSHTIEDIRDQLMELKFHGLIQIHGQEVVIHDIQMRLIENLVREKQGAPRCFFFEGDITTLSPSECTEWARLKYICGIVDEQGMVSGFFVPQRRWLKPMIGCFPQPGQRASNQRCPPNIEVLRLEGASCFDFCVSNEGLFTVKHMQFLRHLQLSDLYGLVEVGGWHGAPNLVSVMVERCMSLREIGSMSCLHKLESVVLNGNGSVAVKGNTDVTKLLGHPRKLHTLHLSPYKVNGAHLHESLSSFTSLQKCILYFSKIVSFPNFNSSSLRVLDLRHSPRLERMEGSLCGLTALEELDLRDCPKLKSMPDLKQLVRLGRLELQGCAALREVKLGDVALTSLDRLSLFYGVCHLYSTSSCSSPLPINAFTNLRSLDVSYGHEVMDAGSIELPESPEYGLSALVEVTGLSALVNLEKLRLHRWDSLQSITGLGGLTKLLELRVSCCVSLREVGHWEPPFTRYNLQYVGFWYCPQLQTLSTITHLPSLKQLQMETSLVEKGLLREDMEEYFSKSGSTYRCRYARRRSEWQ